MSQRIDGQELLPDNDRQAVAMRYLLGTLSEEERTRFEDLFFSDESEFEQLEEAEGELIDRYVLNELSADDADRFKKLLVSPRLAERVEIARILTKRVASESQQEDRVYPIKVQTPKKGEPEPPWYKRLILSPIPAFALGITLLLPTIALVFVSMKLQNESQRLAYEQQQLENLKKQIEEQRARSSQLEATLNQTQREKEEQQQLAEQYKQQAEQPRSIPVLGLFLNPVTSVRSEGGKRVAVLTLPPNASEVGINLNVTDGDYSRYEAIVRSVDLSKEVAHRTNLKPFSKKSRKYITLKLNSKLLPRGTYNVRVNGVTTTGTTENFNDYSFQVSSR